MRREVSHPHHSACAYLEHGTQPTLPHFPYAFEIGVAQRREAVLWAPGKWSRWALDPCLFPLGALQAAGRVGRRNLWQLSPPPSFRSIASRLAHWPGWPTGEVGQQDTPGLISFPPLQLCHSMQWFHNTLWTGKPWLHPSVLTPIPPHLLVLTSNWARSWTATNLLQPQSLSQMWGKS